MKLYLEETSEVKRVELHPWERDHWGGDFFADVEANYHEESRIGKKAFRELVDYWQNEVDTYNNGGYSEQFGSQNENWIAEYLFMVE